MSNIQEQIKALQRKQSKIEEYKAILADLDRREDNPEHKDLKVEIFSQLSTFINEKITELETGTEIKPKLAASNQGTLSQNEIDVFRSIIQRTAERDTPNQTTSPVAPVKRIVQLDPNDPLRFLQRHKHLDHKRVRFDTDDGPVTGIVVGLLAPNVLVKTDTGYEIPVDPERLQQIAGGK